MQKMEVHSELARVVLLMICGLWDCKGEKQISPDLLLHG